MGGVLAAVIAVTTAVLLRFDPSPTRTGQVAAEAPSHSPEERAARGADRSSEPAADPTPTASPSVASSPAATPTPAVASASPAKSTSRPPRPPAPPPPSPPPGTGPVGETGTCQASFYTDEGSSTANGEIFHVNAFTAAHKTLPFNTRVRVTNPANGKSVTVRINDRGPFISGRCLDLTPAAFNTISRESAGVVTVKYEVLKG